MDSPHKPISTIEESQDGNSEQTHLWTDVDVFNISDGQTISERLYAPSVGPSSLNHPREFTLAGTSSKHEESRSVLNNRFTSEQEELNLQGSSREITVDELFAIAEAQNTGNIWGSDSSGVQHNRWTSEEEKSRLQQRQRSSRDATIDESSVTAGVFEGNYVASQPTRNVCRSDSNVEAEEAAQNLQSAQWNLFSPIQQQHQFQYDHECLPSSSSRHPVSGLPDGYGLSLPTDDMRRELPCSKQEKENTMSSKSRRRERMIKIRVSAIQSRAKKEMLDHKCLPNSSLRHPVSGLPGGYSLSLPTFDMPREAHKSINEEKLNKGSKRAIIINEEKLDRRSQRKQRDRVSAAQSKARKEAYIHELEDVATRLKAENTRLIEELELSDKWESEKWEPGELVVFKKASSAPF